VGELQVRDVVYKTIVVHMPVHVPGGMCAPPVRIEVPCMIVLRCVYFSTLVHAIGMMTSCFFHHSADLGTVDPNTRRKSNRCRARCTVVYLHGNGTDIGGVAEEAKALSRDLECHVVVPEYPGYGLAEGSSNEDSVDAVSLFI
jgi:abhydrolase domain-containing protein 17